MAEPIVNPQIPYVGDVPGGLQPGKMIRLQGVTYPNSDRFNLNLAVGPNAKPRDDTALHLSVRLNQGYVARNSYKDGGWGDEQGSGKLPIGNAQSFEIIILVDPSHYKIAINGQHFCEFPHRIPFQEVAHLLIDGDVSITLISFEGVAIPGGITSSQSSQVNSATPQGAPQFGGPQYGPPQGGYGAPPANYGGYGPPPPPGAQPQSEFGGFLDQAQDMLAGAIKSGAAEKLLGSVLHSGGGQQQQPQGYAHQNARYGIYPDLPTQDTAPASQNKGNFNEQDSALSSLIAGSGGTITTGPQPIPQSGGNVPPGARNMPGGPTVPGAPQSGGSQPGPLEGLLLGFLKGNEGQSGGNPPAVGAGGPQNTQSGGSDVLSGLLSSLLSGSKQNDQPAAPNAPPYAGNQPQTAQGGGSDLLSGILQSLVSGNKDPQAPGPQNQPLSGPQNAANTQGGQSQGSDALSSLLSSLLSSNQNQQNPPTHGTPNQPQNQNQGGGGDVFSNILQGLISNNTQPTPGGQNVPPQNYYQPQNPQNQGQGNQNNAELITNLLRGLLSKASEQHDNTRPIQETHPSGGGPGNFGPVGGGGPMNMGPPAGGGPMNMGPASGGPMNFGPTSGTGPMNVGPAGGGGPGNLGPAQDPQQQYGQYPHPSQQEQRGPMESLLSGLLSGGGQQQQQQPHVPQVGGEGSVGGLGSMGGILGSLAGSLLHRPDPNQRN